MRKQSRKALVKELDKLFSLYIRLRDKAIFGSNCAFGCGRESSQCFHFITRSKYVTRWHSLNAISSCAACNIKYEHDQAFVDHVFSWFKKYHGEQAWDTLKQLSGFAAHYSMSDLQQKKEDIYALMGLENKKEVVYGRKS